MNKMNESSANEKQYEPFKFWPFRCNPSHHAARFDTTYSALVEISLIIHICNIRMRG